MSLSMWGGDRRVATESLDACREAKNVEATKWIAHIDEACMSARCPTKREPLQLIEAFVAADPIKALQLADIAGDLREVHARTRVSVRLDYKLVAPIASATP
jgi:hypothetical protein